MTCPILNNPKLFILLLFLIIFSINLSAQDDSSSNGDTQAWTISTRLGLNTFAQINLHAERKLKNVENASLALSISYNYGSRILPRHGGLFCGEKGLNDVFARKSFTFRVGSKFKTFVKEDKTIYVTSHLLYSRGWIDDMDFYDACYSGSATGTSFSYDANSHEAGVMFYFDFIKENSRINYYIGVGASQIWQYEVFNGDTNLLGRPYSPPMRYEDNGKVNFDIGWQFRIY